MNTHIIISLLLQIIGISPERLRAEYTIAYHVAKNEYLNKGDEYDTAVSKNERAEYTNRLDACLDSSANIKKCNALLQLILNSIGVEIKNYETFKLEISDDLLINKRPYMPPSRIFKASIAWAIAFAKPDSSYMPYHLKFDQEAIRLKFGNNDDIIKDAHAQCISPPSLRQDVVFYPLNLGARRQSRHAKSTSTA